MTNNESNLKKSWADPIVPQLSRPKSGGGSENAYIEFQIHLQENGDLRESVLDYAWITRIGELSIKLLLAGYFI